MCDFFGFCSFFFQCPFQAPNFELGLTLPALSVGFISPPSKKILRNPLKENKAFGPSRVTVSAHLNSPATAACRSRSSLVRSHAELPIHTHSPEACISPAGDGRATCSRPCGFPGLDLAPETKTTEGSATTSSTDSATCPLYLYGQGRRLLQVREKEMNFLPLRLLDVS